MKIELTELVWLDEHTECSLAELAVQSHLSEAELLELVECGAIPASAPGGASAAFSGRAVVAARTASRLRDDFELDVHGIALALSLLRRVRDLEEELSELRGRTPAPR